MKVDWSDTPVSRLFSNIGGDQGEACRIELADDEQVTLRNGKGAELDVVKKNWGYYASPSFRGRMRRFGLRPALVADQWHVYFAAVQVGQEESFLSQIESASLRLYAWLDGDTLWEEYVDTARGECSGADV
jgi:hypothetical protein